MTTAPARQSWTFSFSTAILEPPTGNQIRLDAAAPYTAVTRVWVRAQTIDGIDVHLYLMNTPVGSTLYLQDKDEHARYAAFILVAAPIDKTDYVELPAIWFASGTALLAQQVQFVTAPPTVPPDPVTPVVWSTPAIGPLAYDPDPHWGEAVVVAPPCEPVSLKQVKQRLRIPHTADDADLQLLIGAARRQVETDTSAVLVSATINLVVDAPVPAVLRLSRWPVQTIEAVTVWAPDGTGIAIDPTMVALDTASRPARVSLVGGGTWPTQRTINALTVRFVGGFAQAPVGVTSLAWTNGVATIVTATPHNLLAGAAITIRGADDPFFNSTFPVLSTSGADTLTAALPLQPGWPAPSSPAAGALTAIEIGTPETLQLAVLALVQHWWDPLRRGLTSAPGEVPLPFGYDALTADRVEWGP